MISQRALDQINEYLVKEYGKFDNSELPNFRVVWSEDQVEKRWTKFTPEGFEMLYAVVKELPKYRQWIHHKYVLERVMPLPPNTDMVGKYSYEPIWTFEDKDGNYLDPKLNACVLIIKTIFKNAAQVIGAKYHDPELEEGYTEQNLDNMQRELFGNETEIGDALAYREGVSLSGPKFEVN